MSGTAGITGGGFNNFTQWSQGLASKAPSSAPSGQASDANWGLVQSRKLNQELGEGWASCLGTAN